jgi:hypothetical protein
VVNNFWYQKILTISILQDPLPTVSGVEGPSTSILRPNGAARFDSQGNFLMPERLIWVPSNYKPPSKPPHQETDAPLVRNLYDIEYKNLYRCRMKMVNLRHVIKMRKAHLTLVDRIRTTMPDRACRGPEPGNGIQLIFLLFTSRLLLYLTFYETVVDFLFVFSIKINLHILRDSISLLFPLDNNCRKSISSRFISPSTYLLRAHLQLQVHLHSLRGNFPRLDLDPQPLAMAAHQLNNLGQFYNPLIPIYLHPPLTYQRHIYNFHIHSCRGYFPRLAEIWFLNVIFLDLFQHKTNQL